MDESQSLEVLSGLLTRIQENPYNLSLHAQAINSAVENGVGDYVTATRRMFTEYWPAGDEVWLPMINSRMEQGVDTFEDTLQVLDLFETAEKDYLSIPILQKHVEFLIDRNAYFNSLSPRPEEFGDLFSNEWTAIMLESVVQKGAAHLTKGHLLWNAYFSWEMEQLENTQLRGEERTDRIIRLDDLLLDRLRHPHSAHEETFQLYSTFTTNFKPPNSYEKVLVSASKEKAAAVKAYERRERFEQLLELSDYSPEAYNNYLTYERRARKIDLPVISMLYERAISDTAKRRFSGIGNAEVPLRVLWLGYCDVLRTNNESIDHQRAVFERAIRSIPGSGPIWASYIRFLERTENNVETLIEAVSDAYVKAFSTGLLQKDVEEIVPVVLARASLIQRVVMSNDEVQNSVATVFEVLEEGIKMVRAASPQGDSRYRLEKFLSDLYFNLVGSPDHASSVWETAARHYKSSYLAWIQYTESLIKQRKYNEARAVFTEIVNRRLDWPEAIFDAWIQFEHLYGTVQEIYDCLDKVGRAQNQVDSRRAKEAEKAYLQAVQTSDQAAAASHVISEAIQQAPEVTDTSKAASSAIEVDDATSEPPRKRKFETTEDEPDGSKKAKTSAADTLKRDREHSTVFVADLPSDVSESDISTLFKDCGAIREVKISTVANLHVATVEFHDRESVPAALTKDKKRIKGQEISVHVAWQSTLYVANFPEKADDAYIRQLFSQFGLIFDVRWPSKKFKSSRRFCYVQFVSKDAAQAAVSLHGKEIEPGLLINVFISDPERKKERTDANANEREMYIAGLSKFVTKKDLEKLFKTYGTIKDIRVIKDDDGLCKGVAFVEFEDEASAQRALQANNHDLKNRRIAVTFSDTRVRARHKNELSTSGLGRRIDTQNRSVRVKGLPPGTQEGLLQQALEKIVPVKRLEVFQDIQEATIELESAADAGKLALLKDPLRFGGRTLQITEELRETTARRVTEPKAEGSMFVPRNAFSRPRAGLGSAKKQVGSSSAATENNANKSAVKSGKSQDDFRRLLG